jgi:hypothetical protein
LKRAGYLSWNISLSRSEVGLINMLAWTIDSDTPLSGVFTNTPLGGRATEAYLKSHPEEADAIHVIIG